MDWSEYVRISALFQRRTGKTPPTILSAEGALEYMRRELASVSTNDAADRPPRPPGRETEH